MYEDFIFQVVDTHSYHDKPTNISTEVELPKVYVMMFVLNCILPVIFLFTGVVLYVCLGHHQNPLFF